MNSPLCEVCGIKLEEGKDVIDPAMLGLLCREHFEENLKRFKEYLESDEFAKAMKEALKNYKESEYSKDLGSRDIWSYSELHDFELKKE